MRLPLPDAYTRPIPVYRSFYRWCVNYFSSQHHDSTSGVARKFSQGVRNASLQSSTDALHCFWTIAVIVVYWCLHKLWQLSIFIGYTSWTAATIHQWMGQDKHQSSPNFVTAIRLVVRRTRMTGLSGGEKFWPYL